MSVSMLKVLIVLWTQIEIGLILFKFTQTLHFRLELKKLVLKTFGKPTQCLFCNRLQAPSVGSVSPWVRRCTLLRKSSNSDVTTVRFGSGFEAGQHQTEGGDSNPIEMGFQLDRQTDFTEVFTNSCKLENRGVLYWRTHLLCQSFSVDFSKKMGQSQVRTPHLYKSGFKVKTTTR